MSQENVALHYRCLDAINQRDLDALLALMDDDVEAVSRLVPMEGVFHGHDGIRRWWENVLGVLPDYNIEAVEVRDVGDLTVGALHIRGHGAGSDIPWDETTWQLVRWRRRKCVSWRVFDTEAEALEAVGLSE
jgi:ketosteroid isomerase-like protein